MQYFLSLLFANPSILLGVSLGVILMYTFYLDHKITILTRGKNATSLEDTIISCIEGVKTVEEKNELISKHALLLEERLRSSTRNASVIRYKAFESGGSNQSFSMSLLDEQGNGVLLSALHHRDRVSLYAKPTTNFTSEFELTEEEQYILEENKNKNKVKSITKE